MPLPRLPLRINKCYFVVRLYKRGTLTPRDDDFREPLSNRVYTEDKCLEGQLVGYRQFFKLLRTQTGDSDTITGAAVFRPQELIKKGVSLQKGDRIVRINEVDCDCNIVKVSPLAPFRGRHLLISVEFEHQRKGLESI